MDLEREARRVRFALPAAGLAVALWGLPWVVNEFLRMLGPRSPIQDARTWMWWVEVPIAAARLGAACAVLWIGGGIVLRLEGWRHAIAARRIVVAPAERGALARVQLTSRLAVLAAALALLVQGAEWLYGWRAVSWYAADSAGQTEMAGWSPAEIAAALRDHDADVRRAAAQEAARRGVAGAVPELVARLDDPSVDVRIAAAWALASIGPDVPEAVPALGRLLQGSAWARQAALEACHAIGPAGAWPVVEALADPNPKLRAQARARLGWRWPTDSNRGPGAIPLALARLLTQGDARQRRAALWGVLGCQGARTNLPPLVDQALGDPDPRVRFAAACASLHLMPAAPRSAQLTAALALGHPDPLAFVADEDDAIRCAVVGLLPELGLPTEAVVRLLDRALHEPALACAAVSTLVQPGVIDATPVDTLIAALPHASHGGALTLIERLAAGGERSPRVIEALVALADLATAHTDWYRGAAAVEALGTLGAEEALAGIRDRHAERSFWLGERAELALRRLQASRR